MGLRGPQPKLDCSVVLRTTVSPEIDRALAQLVELSGVAKATFIRRALLDMLSTYGAVYPDVAESLEPSRTTGTLAAYRKKN